MWAMKPIQRTSLGNLVDGDKCPNSRTPQFVLLFVLLLDSIRLQLGSACLLEYLNDTVQT